MCFDVGPVLYVPRFRVSTHPAEEVGGRLGIRDVCFFSPPERVEFQALLAFGSCWRMRTFCLLAW